MTASFRIIRPEPASDGAGVKLFRAIGGRQLGELDPFLLLDEFKSDNPGDYIAGFPPHPHRGFQTVTYMLAGRMRHQDNAGHNGAIDAGGIQWMNAGRGIVHSEMPEQEDGLMWGFQLWINLPAGEKMSPPAYQEFDAADIPEIEENNAKIRIIAGGYNGTEGPVKNHTTAPRYLDISLQPGGHFEYAPGRGRAAFLYLYEGSAKIDEETVEGAALILPTQDTITITASDKGARFLALDANRINEPIARYGPFVMNTRAELEQAVQDYQSGNF